MISGEFNLLYIFFQFSQVISLFLSKQAWNRARLIPDQQFANITKVCALLLFTKISLSLISNWKGSQIFNVIWQLFECPSPISFLSILDDFYLTITKQHMREGFSKSMDFLGLESRLLPRRIKRTLPLRKTLIQLLKICIHFTQHNLFILLLFPF